MKKIATEIEIPDNEKMIELLVDNAVQRWLYGRDSEDGEYIERGIRERVEGAVIERLHERIDAEVERIVGDVLSKTVQPTNSFGEPIGEPVTLRSRIVQRVDATMKEHVKSDGSYPRDGYDRGSNSKTRVEWAIERAITPIVEKELATATKKAADEVRATLSSAVTATVSKTIAQLLNLPTK